MGCLWVLGIYNHVLHFSCHDSWKREVHKAQMDAYSAFPNDPCQEKVSGKIIICLLYMHFRCSLHRGENMKIAVAS